MSGLSFNPLYLLVLLPLSNFLWALGVTMVIGYKLRSYRVIKVTYPSSLIWAMKVSGWGLLFSFGVVVAGIEALIHLSHVHRNLLVFCIHLVLAVLSVILISLASVKYTGMTNRHLHRFLVYTSLGFLILAAMLGIWLLMQF